MTLSRRGAGLLATALPVLVAGCESTQPKPESTKALHQKTLTNTVVANAIKLAGGLVVVEADTGNQIDAISARTALKALLSDQKTRAVPLKVYTYTWVNKDYSAITGSFDLSYAFTNSIVTNSKEYKTESHMWTVCDVESGALINLCSNNAIDLTSDINQVMTSAEVIASRGIGDKRKDAAARIAGDLRTFVSTPIGATANTTTAGILSGVIELLPFIFSFIYDISDFCVPNVTACTTSICLMRSNDFMPTADDLFKHGLKEGTQVAYVLYIGPYAFASADGFEKSEVRDVMPAIKDVAEIVARCTIEPPASLKSNESAAKVADDLRTLLKSTDVTADFEKLLAKFGTELKDADAALLIHLRAIRCFVKEKKVGLEIARSLIARLLDSYGVARKVMNSGKHTDHKLTAGESTAIDQSQYRDELRSVVRELGME